MQSGKNHYNPCCWGKGSKASRSKRLQIDAASARRTSRSRGENVGKAKFHLPAGIVLLSPSIDHNTRFVVHRHELVIKSGSHKLIRIGLDFLQTPEPSLIPIIDNNP